ncbi:MAG TPA: LysR substrate-binding domain-containing protein [Caulobacteraceae bacterium]|jgi:DNA-binding transcriptional LysR family regulator
MPPPRRRRALPPLNALRAFEAFGRHGRMTTAADELFVTHGAVSRQIRQLEAWLGYPLTEGPKTHLRLTPEAERLLGAATAAFDLIQEAAAPAPVGEGELRLACYNTLAIRWLIPRLPDFVERHPEIRLQLSEISGEPNFEAMPGVDAAIQLRTTHPPGQHHIAICPNWHGPVLSPQRWAALGRDPERLLREPRLHTRTWPQSWENWARGAALALPPGVVERSFDHFSHALEAAAAGLGVATAPWIFVADDVTAGRLVAPLGFVAEPGRTVLVRPQGRSSPALDRLAAWLAEQGERMPRPPQPSV